MSLLQLCLFDLTAAAVRHTVVKQTNTDTNRKASVSI